MTRTGLRLADEVADARARMTTIFESLERLQTGILRAEAVLSRMQVDLERFRKSLDPPTDEGTRL